MLFPRLSCSQISHLDTGLWFGLILDRAYSAILPSFRACYAQGYFGTRGNTARILNVATVQVVLGRSSSTRWQASKHRPLATGHSPWRELDPGLLAGHGMFFFAEIHCVSIILQSMLQRVGKSLNYFQVFQFVQTSKWPVFYDPDHLAAGFLQKFFPGGSGRQ